MPASSEPISSSRPRHPRAAHRRERRARRGRPARSGRRGPGEQQRRDAAPDAASRPRWRRRRPRRGRPGPASTSRGRGAIPAPRRALLVGQCATPVPVAREPRDRGSSRCTACAIHTSARASRAGRRTRPGRSRTAPGRTSSSSTVSARWVCSRTPCRRASAAASVISSPVTENGEHGATATRTMASGAGSWKR